MNGMIAKITKEDLNIIRKHGSIEYAVRKELQRMREKVEVASVRFDQIASGTGAYHDRMADHAAAVDALERKYADVILDYQERLIRFVEAILALDDVRQMEILSLRYIDNHSWKYIQKQMHINRNCFRIHRKALKNIGIEPEEDSDEDADEDPEELEEDRDEGIA